MRKRREVLPPPDRSVEACCDVLHGDNVITVYDPKATRWTRKVRNNVFLFFSFVFFRPKSFDFSEFHRSDVFVFFRLKSVDFSQMYRSDRFVFFRPRSVDFSEFYRSDRFVFFVPYIRFFFLMFARAHSFLSSSQSKKILEPLNPKPAALPPRQQTNPKLAAHRKQNVLLNPKTLSLRRSLNISNPKLAAHPEQHDVLLNPKTLSLRRSLNNKQTQNSLAAHARILNNMSFSTHKP